MKTLAATACLVFAAAASAQSGTLDQVSPWPGGGGSAGFNYGASVLTWQCQIKAGLAGTLEGVHLKLTGSQGATGDLNIRVGPAWNTSPAAFTTSVVKSITGPEDQFINMTGANITLSAGTVFVMELHGNDTDLGVNGSYVAPPGTPLYPEPLFLNGSNFADGGWRIGFETYVLTEAPCYPDCNGDHELTLSDFGCFQTAFALGQPYADCNGDGAMNLSDFGCFQTKFALGCP